MLKFCTDLENPHGRHHSELPDYQMRVKRITNWYCQNYEKYSELLKTELYSQMQASLNASAGSDVLDAVFNSLSYEFEAKTSYSNVFEALMKLILSMYSYGPSYDFYNNLGVSRSDFSDSSRKDYTPWSWLKDSSNAMVMAELVAVVLRQANVECDFDLKALLSDRTQRNESTHSAAKIDCMTAIREYNSIRGMIVFLDSDEEDQLPRFTADCPFEYDTFLQRPCNFNFDDYATILLIDSAHDAREDRRQAVSNLPWDIVIDLDGYSDQGGLLKSVVHNRIQREVLTTANMGKIPDPIRGQTLWLRCGQYLNLNYFPNNSNSIEIPAYSTFLIDDNESKKLYKTVLTKTFEHIIDKALKLDRMLNIVAVTDNAKIVENLVSSLNNRNCDEYFLSWVGLSTMSDFVKNKYDDDEDRSTHYRYLSCPTDQFFESLYEHRYSWIPRTAINLDFAIPGANGLISVTENDRNNLNPYFDVLYQGCETIDVDEVQEQPEGLFHGGRASWHSIACGEALSLMKDGKLSDIVQKIKTILGKTQEKSQQSLFFLNHTAGIGGTTLARQLAWKLHDEYTVLDVKRFDRQKTISLIQNLYDNVIGKAPIVIIAEDTLTNIDTLCDDFLSINRRCILLIACRDSNKLCNKYQDCHKEPFMQLTDSTVTQLKNRFKDSSPLDKKLLEQRYRNFDSDIIGDKRTPFIIGLYFMEESFNIETYIDKALENCPPSHAEMLACLAFCDKYDCKELPASFVNRALGLQRKQSFLRISPGAASLVCQSSRGNIEEYYFKHPLLSEQFLIAYCKINFHEDNRFMLVHLAKYLIGCIAHLGREHISEDLLDVLISIIIQNKGNSEYEYSGQLSTLLNDIGMPESQCELIQFLADQFQPHADKILSEEENEKDGMNYYASERQILRLVSHAFAHLGKLYTKVIINYEKAEKFLRLAENYMPDEDPVIYHMYGNAIYHKLLDEWSQSSVLTGDPAKIPFADYEQRVHRAYELFANTCEFGSPQYGFIGQLNLLYEYLSFVYKVLGIKTDADKKEKLTRSQMNIQTRFDDTLEEARTYDEFDDQAKRTIQKKEDQFRSEIMMGNYGKTIEYYNNLIDNAKRSHDISAWETALHGLVSARIRYAREKTCSGSLYSKEKAPKEMLDNIDILLKQQYDAKSYSDYVRRSALFHHWMQFAKILNRPVNEGLIKVRDWLDAENRMHGGKNQEPYYYQQALLYLDMLDGSKRSADIQAISAEIRSLDISRQFDRKRGRLDRPRDLIVSGIGMGRMLDISDCKNFEDIAVRISPAMCDPTALEGHFDSAPSASLAAFSVYTPLAWKGEKALSEIGRMVKNSLSEQQINHNVIFYAAFSVRGLLAISDSVRDLTTNEPFDKDLILMALNDVSARSAQENLASVSTLEKHLKIKEPAPSSPLKSRTVKAAPAPKDQFHAATKQCEKAVLNTEVPLARQQPLPDINGQFVLVIKSIGEALTGTIEVEKGKVYAAKTVGKLTKIEKNIIKGKKICEVVVQSKDKTGYIVRLK